MSIVITLSATVICAYSIWACISPRYQDGILGKILFFAASLLSLSVILTGQHGDWLLIPYALMCIRQAGIILILPKLLKRYPCIKPKDKKEKHE